MGQVVLADDDFDVHAHFARASDDFDDASRRRNTAFRIACELHVYDSAVELREAQAAGSGRLPGFERKLVRDFGSYFRARRNHDLMSDADVIGKDRIFAGAIAKEADNGWMGAPGDFFNAALEAAVRVAARNARKDAITVHRVADAGGADKKVAVHAGDRRLRNHKAVTISMSDKTAGY